MNQINLLQLVIQDLMMKRGEKLSFVQIGAHDGYHLDPIRPYVEKHHWSGVLVEPQPEIFKQLIKNYENEKQLTFVNAAIAHKGNKPLLVGFKDKSLPHHSTMLASFNYVAVMQNTHGYQGETFALDVPTLTLEELFDQNAITMLDLLQIDTEGYDYEILKMLRVGKVRPTCIHFESAFYGRDDLTACYGMLDQMGYRLACTGIDTIAYLQTDEYPRKAY